MSPRDHPLSAQTPAKPTVTPSIDAIRAHIEDWDVPFVELDCFGTADPGEIADLLDRFCRVHLGESIRGHLFCTASQGSTHGLELASGEWVVVKVHPPRGAYPERPDSLIALRSVQLAMRHLRSCGFACPEPLLDPLPLAHGIATVERYLDEGNLGDGFDPACRMTMACGLHEVVGRLTPMRSELPGIRSFFPSTGRLYPAPHSKLFDFEATESGAEWIDDIASRARAKAPDSAERVIGHGDWRVEHLRFMGDRITTSYDWDSIQLSPEVALVGAAAAIHTADWTQRRARNLPTESEIDAFLGDYGRGRGRSLSSAERSAARAFAAYAIAYCARCQHAADPSRGRDWPEDSWVGLLRDSGESLLR